MRPLEKISLLLLALPLGACLNTSTFQTGRTLGKNRLRLGGGLSVVTIEDFSALTSVVDPDAPPVEETGPIPLPSAEISARYGLSDTIDVGVKIYTIGVGAELKTQFIGDQKSPFAMSLSASASYFGISLPESAQSSGDISFDAGVGLLDMATALHASYSFSHGFLTLYGSPRFVSRTLTVGFEGEERAGGVGLGLDLAGANMGVAIGRIFTLYIESGVYKPIGFEGAVSELGIGFDF